MALRSTLLAITALQIIKQVQGYSAGNETLLKAQLFTTNQYDVSVRPNGTTTVSMGLVPTTLNDINIKSQTMSISGWWSMSWTDDRMTWTPSSYDDISEFHVFQDNVWTPSIVVYNSINNLGAIDEDTIPLRISSAGTIEWSPPGIVIVSCSTNIRYYPFDTQTCGVSVKTFGYTIQELQLEADADELDLTYYTGNGEWALLTAWTEKAELKNFSLVTFWFKFERKPEFHGMNLIFPIVIMAVLSLFIFVLPADSGEKMGYSLTLVLTFFVLMSLVADRMPTTADHTSLFEVYVILVLVMCCLAVVLTIISLDLFFREETEKIPQLACKITLFFHHLFCKSKESKSGECGITQNSVNVSVTEVHPIHAEEDKRHAGSDVEEVTWKMMSRVLDAVMFRVYFVLLTVFTVIFMFVMAFG